MVSKRLIRDHMQKNKLKPCNVEITASLKMSCRAAHNCYKFYLEEEKKKASVEKSDERKQALDAEIKELEELVENLANSSAILDKKFVDLVMKAENNKNSIAMISEANALKRKSEEQLAESKKLEESIKLLKTKRAKYQ